MGSDSDIFRGADGNYLAARIADLVCYYYVNQDSEANFAAFRSWSDRLPNICPQGTGTMIWVDAIAARTPPSASVRERYSALAAQNAHRQFARVSIVPAGGFAGATARAVLTGLNLIRRMPFPQYVTHDVRDGIGWLYTKMPPNPARPLASDASAFFEQTIADYRRTHPG